MREASVLPFQWRATSFSEALGRRNPPAVYFGTIQGSAGQSLAPGQDFTAEIDGQLCGVGKVLPAEEDAKTKDLRYLIKVVATELGAAQACGVPGKDVKFKFGDTALYPALKWENGAPTEHDLSTQP